MRPLQSLGGVQRGERHHVLVGLALADGGQQRNGLRHFQQVFHLGGGGNARRVVNLPAAARGHPVAKLQHVGPAGRGEFFAVFAFVEVFLVVNFLEPVGQEGAGRLGALRVAGAKLQVVHITAKLVQAAQRLLGQHAAQAGAEQSLKQAQLVLTRKHAELPQRGVADAALGCGDGAQERRVVVVIYPQAKPGAQVLDFSAVKKALPARHLVGNLRLAQCLLEHPRLVVGAVQHGKVTKLLMLRAAADRGTGARAKALDAGHGALGLVFFMVRVHHTNRLAFAQIAPQVLGKQLGVGANHVVGGPQNGAGGAVVLLQLDDLELRVVNRQLFQVVQRGAAPAVDGLVVITHRGEAATLTHQQLQHLVLRGVGVLVFIHQHMAQQPLPLLPDVLMIL